MDCITAVFAEGLGDFGEPRRGQYLNRALSSGKKVYHMLMRRDFSHRTGHGGFPPRDAKRFQLGEAHDLEDHEGPD
eukprot:6053681-Heterocapsa_arctica.AAC.1